MKSKISEKLSALKKARKELKDELMSLSKDAFTAGAKELFGNHPKLKEFAVVGYTAWWNDGEPCTYSVDTSSPHINGEFDPCFAPTLWDKKPNPEADVDLDKAQDAVIDFLEQFDEDFYLETFGDHALITVSAPDGKITVGEYDHE